MSLPTIDVAGARRLLDQGAVPVDVREADEHVRERVPGARHNSQSRLAPIELPAGKAVIFHCRSGARTTANAARLAGAGLAFAGISGCRGMARLLALMPWNRPDRAVAA